MCVCVCVCVVVSLQYYPPTDLPNLLLQSSYPHLNQTSPANQNTPPNKNNETVGAALRSLQSQPGPGAQAARGAHAAGVGPRARQARPVPAAPGSGSRLGAYDQPAAQAPQPAERDRQCRTDAAAPCYCRGAWCVLCLSDFFFHPPLSRPSPSSPSPCIPSLPLDCGCI